MADQQNLILRFRKWFIWALAIGALLYAGGSVWADAEKVGDQLSTFNWALYVPVLLLTLGNYALRFGKWHYLLGRLGVDIPVVENARIFTAGLAMVISPGKAGELLKPFLASRRSGVPMATTIPALVAERLTDGIAMLILAAISVSTYAADKIEWVLIPAGLTVIGLVILASERLSMAILGLMGKLPVVSKVAGKLIEMYQAMRTCLSPVPFLVTMALSLVAWWLECMGFWLVFKGLGFEASMDASTFLYAFATIAGGAMPIGGGLGVADAALAAGAMQVMGAPQAVAVTASILVRIATLWFGVMLGALALLKFEDLLEKGINIDSGASDEESAE